MIINRPKKQNMEWMPIIEKEWLTPAKLESCPSPP
jgi:hypothetical protein